MSGSASVNVKHAQGISEMIHPAIYHNLNVLIGVQLLETAIGFVDFFRRIQISSPSSLILYKTINSRIFMTTQIYTYI